jgi:hypothetical protein
MRSVVLSRQRRWGFIPVCLAAWICLPGLAIAQTYPGQIDPLGTRRPKLVVTDTSGNVTTLQPTAGLNNGSDDGSAARGKDVYADAGCSASAWLNRGESIGCSVNSSTCNPCSSVSYVEFSLSDMPNAAEVASARIELYMGVLHWGTCGWPYPADPIFGLRRVTSDWNEMVVNWYDQPSYDAAPIASYTFDGVAGLNDVAAYRWVSYDITGLYTGWATGAVPNYGVRISHDNPFCMNCDVAYFYSSDDGLPTLAYTGPTSANQGEAVTVSARLTYPPEPTTLVGGLTLSFTVGSETCTGTTDSSGSASCVLTPLEVGSQAVTSSFAGNDEYQPRTATAQLQVAGRATYTIIASAGAGGSLAPSGATEVSAGGSQVFTITASTGYHVADVVVDGVSVGALASYTFSNVTSTHTLAAFFASDTFTIAVAVAGDVAGGSVSPVTQTVSYGDTASFAVITSAGYIAAVSEGTLTGNTWTIPVITSSRTVTLTFTRNALSPYDQLRAIVRGGCITKQGIVNSLIAKIDNAEAAEKRGDLQARTGILGAFVNEVRAQTGKAIDPNCARELTRLATLMR